MFIDTFACGLLLDVHLTEITVDTSVLQLDGSLFAIASSSHFQWYDCSTGLPIPGADQAEFIPNKNGIYKVLVTSADGCQLFSDCYDISSVSTKHTSETTHWHIQPNPIKDILQIVVALPLESDLQIEIFDLTGQRILRKHFAKIDESEILNLEYLTPGSYIFKLTDISGYFSLKIFQKL